MQQSSSQDATTHTATKVSDSTKNDNATGITSRDIPQKVWEEVPEGRFTDVSLETIRQMQSKWSTERNFTPKNTPRNLLLAMTGEVGEVSEIFMVCTTCECSECRIEHEVGNGLVVSRTESSRW
ncbi:hypothetical protein SARC_08956 [Sphaeroforma arctica JP610]|uniref:Uncharacterized protein n=1 Tax=Sphaeroforma arctica JP610 TaxID=667725 RepID=A0A0L0FP87_9EUKA|nr:hypothetical protein SARC_08956 [Sphaeroforma arctica JP610]KNC78620.1 hypothetical protein SARC_08956 [Sphaeroforma arctica JP610]|eukprot:XP_014152522.1 hypothetical protein SARC_08956 [Sphaeroforma arctica JP610]